MKPTRKTLLLEAYAAYNAQDSDTLLDLVSEQVDWPAGSARLHGKGELRAYWTQQWTATRTHDEPGEVTDLAPNRSTVRIRQAVRALDGSVLSTGVFEHTYRFEHGLITRLDVQKVEEPEQPVPVRRREALRRLAAWAGGVALLPSLNSAGRAAEILAGGQRTTSEPTGNPGMDKNLATFEFAPLITTRLDNGLALLGGPGGNMAVLAGPGGALLVDTGIHPTAAKVAKAAEAFASKPVSLVVNTHWHFDHTGGNEFFGRRGVRLIAQENVRTRMSHDQPIEVFGFTVPASPDCALPALTFPDTLTLHHGAETLELHHVAPAHTDGDLLAHFTKANVLHTGDVLFNGFYPAIDYSTAGWIGGMVAAQERALALCNAKTRLIPGHGPLATPADLKAAHDMLATVQGRLEKLLDAGKSVEEVVAAAPTHDLDERWGQGFFQGEAFTRMAATSIVRHRQPAG